MDNYWFSRISAECWRAFLSPILILQICPLGAVSQNYGILRVSNLI